MRTLVIGGTNFIGKHLVPALIKAGHEVTILHRKPDHDFGKKVANIQADRNCVEQMKEALCGKCFDVVFDNAYDWERGTPWTAVEGAARILNGCVCRYIFTSSVAAYGDGLNHHEGDALAPDTHPDPFTRNKAQSERALFRLHQRFGTPVVTIRLPYIYGPCNPMYREQFFWDRLRDKRPVILPGDGRRLMQFVYVKDVVAASMRLMDTPHVHGHAFNIANARPLTQAEVVDAFSLAAGKPANVVRIPRERIARAGGHPLGPHLYFGKRFDLPPITTIISKAQRMLGFKPTSFDTGLRETYRWYLRHHERRHADYSFEDRLLEKVEQLAS